MTEISFTFCREDWDRIVQALRNETYYLTQQSNQAHDRGAPDYASLLWAESNYHNTLADDIEWKLPEEGEGSDEPTYR